MSEFENKDTGLEPTEPQAVPEASSTPAPPQAPPVQESQPEAPQAPDAPAEQAAPDSQEAAGRPVPQLTLEPDPAPPAFVFPDPPKAPEPPPQPVEQPQPEPQPVQYAQYNYNFNPPPQPDPNTYQQPPYAQQNGYQPPNYTAQSYQPQPLQQPKYTTPPVGYQQKSRLAAGILAVVFGVFGVHNFYMGFNTRGTLQLILALAGGLLTCGMGTIAALILVFIEGVSLLSSATPRFDGNGVIMRD